jgi:MraZ protein
VFVGSFEHSLDEKGRLVLPSTYRHRLAEGGVLAPWDRCLALWTPDQFDRVAEMIKTRIADGHGDMDVLRVLFAAAHTVNPDSQGRFVVPEEHRAHAGLSRDAMVIGQFDRIEIWDRGRFGELQERKAPELAAVVRELRI